MVLDKLGSAIKNATDKIASAVFVDKKLIREVTKELQRALIKADVDVKLVKEITDKIKEEAKDEKAKDVDKKEHIVKLLHDELERILGGERKELDLEGKKKIMLVGLYGSGKCVHGKSNIQLENGNVEKIEKVYKKYKESNKERDIKEGKVIDISDKNVRIPSFNPKTCEIEEKRATHLWKMEKDKLLNVKLDNGNDYSVKVTPEHPFFVMRRGRLKKIRADQLRKEDYIAIPRNIDIKGEEVSLKEEIKDIDLYVYLDEEKVDKIIRKKDKSLKEINQDLKKDKNYCYFTHDLKNGKIPIELVDLKNYNFINTKIYKSREKITLPLFLSPNFAEFLGYLIGDGNIGRKYVQITSGDQEIIERIKELSKSLFNIKPAIRKDKRTQQTYRISLNSKTLVKIFEIFGLTPGKKGTELKIPKQILRSRDETIKKFLRAYFDCESHPSSNSRTISISSESERMIKQTNLLLNRLGIVSGISRKKVKGKNYWRLYISGKYAERFAEKINSIIKRKKQALFNYEEIGSYQGHGWQDMIPLGNKLRKIREMKGFSLGEIQENAVFSYGRYEKKGKISRGNLSKLVNYYGSREGGKLLNFLKDIKEKPSPNNLYSCPLFNSLSSYLQETNLIENSGNSLQLTQKGKTFLQNTKETSFKKELSKLNFLSQSSVCWIPVKEIEEIKNDKKFVYDLTVEDNHSFIADGFIVHNTTTAAKLTNYYSKRGHNSCMIGLDVHRPAAPEQLEQLGEENNLEVFIDKEEKDPTKVWKEYEKKIKKKDLTLIDTAGRHSLDKELVNEIETLDKKINPNYTFLVIPADIGQAAKEQAKKFKESLDIEGVIVTRMDSTAKGGGALTACNEVDAPVYFIATGEKINDIEKFDPSSFISRMLGMGDLEGLLERVRSTVDKDKEEKIKKRLEEGKFTMDDLYEQLKSMKGFSLGKIASMIPGFGKMKKKMPDGMLDQQEEKMEKWKYAIQSMTEEEKENPDLLKETSRIQRIAKGSGVSTSDIRKLIKQYKMMKEFVKSSKGMNGMDEKQLKKMAKKFGGKMNI